MKLQAEASVFDDDILTEDIETAGTTATKYLQEVTSDGVFVHRDDSGKDGKTPTASNAYGVHIADQVDIIREGEVVAKYGESSRIGKQDESHAEIDYHSFQMVYGDETDPYVHFSDLRNETGIATLTDTFVGDGTTATYTLGHTVVAVTAVTVDDTAVAYTRSEKNITLTAGNLASGSVLAVTYTTAEEVRAFTFGDRNNPDSTSVGNLSMAIGAANLASGEKSFAHGTDNKATGSHAIASGYGCEARGNSALAVGFQAKAKESYSSAVGYNTNAYGGYSHSEGYSTSAGNMAHAEGSQSSAHGLYSHAQNRGTVARGKSQTTIGRWNVEDNSNKYALIIGNGVEQEGYDPPQYTRSNAMTVDWTGYIDSAAFMVLPRVSYHALNVASNVGDVAFLTAYMKYVCQNYIETSPTGGYEWKTYVGQIAPNSTGFCIFMIYGLIDSSHMPQYGTILIQNLGGKARSFNINNYTITQVT